MINIMLEEADIAIENAYNEGYKQAAVEFKPEITYWQNKYLLSEYEFRNQKTTSAFTFAALGLAFGSIGGMAIGTRIR